MKQSLSGSFREMVAAFAGIVQKNPALAQKLQWPTDLAGQEAFVDERECRRLISQGWGYFVDMMIPPAPTVWNPEPVKKNLLGRVVAVGKATKAGIGIWLDMFGPDGKPVPQDIAERRATVCANWDGAGNPCPHNDVNARLGDYFIQPVAKGLQFLYQMKQDLLLSTTQDAKLGVCRICLCGLKVKPHVQFKFIEKQMSPDIRAQLPPHCWIKREAGE